MRFLGTGAILCERLSASLVVDSHLLVDLPNGAMKTMRRLGMDPRELDVCLVTHMHADHFFDSVFLFLELGLRSRREQEFHVVGPLGLEERLTRLFELSYPESWDRVRSNVNPVFHEIGPDGGTLEVAGYRIGAVVVEHTVPLALGYIIADANGSTLGVTGDTVMCEGVERIAAMSDVLIADASFLESRSGHMALSDVEAIAERWPQKRVWATHRSDEVERSSIENVLFPQDGDQFRL